MLSIAQAKMTACLLLTIVCLFAKLICDMFQKGHDSLFI